MSTERLGGVSFDGNPLTLVGPEIKVGDQAPSFSVLSNDLSEVNLATDSGKVRLILSVTSLDTPVCDAETKKFNDEAENFPDNVVVYTVSCDLPSAQARWCGAANVGNLRTLSDHRNLDFGEAYGTHVKELRLLSRAVFLVDASDTVQYVEYVPEIAEHPNYEAAVDAVKRSTQ
jgi:thiol peroxidase